MLKNEYFIFEKNSPSSQNPFSFWRLAAARHRECFWNRVLCVRKRFNVFVVYFDVYRKAKFYIALENRVRIVYYCNL